MPYPVCEKCVGWRFLCDRCQRAYESGELSLSEIEISRILYSLNEDSITVRHAVETSDDVIIVVSAGDVGKAIGPSGSNAKKISEIFGKTAKFVGDGDFRELAQTIIAPARVKSINTVFGVGVETIRVHADKADIPRLRHNPDDTEKILNCVTNKKAELVFD
jgi:transcription antitermination factor NusA-like protein